MKSLQFFRNLIKPVRSKDFGKYNIVQPGIVSKQKTVPGNIKKPSYYKTGLPFNGIVDPEIKNSKAIAAMRDSCKLAANILKSVEKYIQVGQTTDELDTFVHELIISKNAYPSPLNYKFFPKSICTSVNNVACHGIPDDRPLMDGDIINVDITVYYNGYHGDCSKTFLIGNVDEAGRKLVEATETCLKEGIKCCGPNREFYEIGDAIDSTSRKLGFNVVPAFTGHGIGRYFHGPPDIFHIVNDYRGKMKPGMTFTIEPVLTQGDPEIEILEDNWTALTVDNARTAQAEHTILITNNSYEILTLPDIEIKQ